MPVILPVGESHLKLLGNAFYPTVSLCLREPMEVVSDAFGLHLAQTPNHLGIPQVFVDKLKELVYRTAVGLAFGVTVIGSDTENIAKLEHIPPWVVSLDGHSERSPWAVARRHRGTRSMSPGELGGARLTLPTSRLSHQRTQNHSEGSMSHETVVLFYLSRRDARFLLRHGKQRPGRVGR